MWSRRSISNKRIIVTGASSGIGRELSRQLAAQGASLILTARRKDRLTELVSEIRSAGGQAHYVVGDIVDQDVRRRIVQSARDHFDGLDVLVNNAGLGAFGPFAESDSARLRLTMEVNFVTPVELIRAALPLLREGNRPLIVNMCSVLGHRAVPNKSEYCASKFALHGFSDALRAELAPTGIDVMLCSPSTTSSEFFDHARQRGGSFREVNLGAMLPRAVARKTIQGIRRGRHEVILSFNGRLLVWLDRLLPSLADRIVVWFS